MSVAVQTTPQHPTLAFTRNVNVGQRRSRPSPLVVAPGLLQITTKPKQPHPTKSRKQKIAAQSLLAVPVPTTRSETRDSISTTPPTFPTPRSPPPKQSSPVFNINVNSADDCIPAAKRKQHARRPSEPFPPKKAASPPVVQQIPAFSHRTPTSWVVCDDRDDKGELPAAVAFSFAQRPFCTPAISRPATPVKPTAPVRRASLPDTSTTSLAPLGTRSVPSSPTRSRALAAPVSLSLPSSHAFKFAESSRFTSPEKLKIKSPSQLFGL